MKTFACGDVIPGCGARSPLPTRTASSRRSPATRPPTTASPTSRRSWSRPSAPASSRLSRDESLTCRLRSLECESFQALSVGELLALRRRTAPGPASAAGRPAAPRCARWRSARPPSAGRPASAARPPAPVTPCASATSPSAASTRSPCSPTYAAAPLGARRVDLLARPVLAGQEALGPARSRAASPARARRRRRAARPRRPAAPSGCSAAAAPT